MAINIPSEVFDDFNEAVLLMEKEIKIFYPEARTACPNCYLDMMGTRTRSISRYKTGGPHPFEDGMPCPYCDTKGYIESTVSEVIPTRIYINPEEWNKKINVAIPKGSILTISRMEYATKLRSCKYMIPFFNGLDAHFTDNYYRVGDLYTESFNLNPTKYVNAIWSKNSG